MSVQSSSSIRSRERSRPGGGGPASRTAAAWPGSSTATVTRSSATRFQNRAGSSPATRTTPAPRSEGGQQPGHGPVDGQQRPPRQQPVAVGQAGPPGQGRGPLEQAGHGRGLAAGGEGVAGRVGPAVELVPHAGDEPGEAERLAEVAFAAAEQVGGQGHHRRPAQGGLGAPRGAPRARTRPPGRRAAGRGRPGRAPPPRSRPASTPPARPGSANGRPGSPRPGPRARRRARRPEGWPSWRPSCRRSGTTTRPADPGGRRTR